MLEQIKIKILLGWIYYEQLSIYELRITRTQGFPGPMRVSPNLICTDILLTSANQTNGEFARGKGMFILMQVAQLWQGFGFVVLFALNLFRNLFG